MAVATPSAIGRAFLSGSHGASVVVTWFCPWLPFGGQVTLGQGVVTTVGQVTGVVTGGVLVLEAAAVVPWHLAAVIGK